MSELFLAEASVVIRPDTTAFRAELLADLAAATRAIPPVAVPVVASGSGTQTLVAQQAQLAKATSSASTATLEKARADTVATQTATRSAVANRAQAASLSQVQRGAAASALTMLGVRGATLAASSSFLAGTAAAVLFGKAVQSAVNLESQMAVFAATTGATATQMELVGEAARQLGRDVTLPGVTAGTAAEAMTELARAGLSVQDSIAGARGVLQLATAAQLSNADATQLAASALNAFGLDGTQAVRVADLLANAANEAQGGINEMGLALRQSAGVARQVGISLDDTVALLTLLARNGLQGSDAGTALRTSMIRLINPTKEARDVLQELNVELRDQQGNVRPEVFAEFAEAQQNLTRSQQDANAAIVFGQDAIRALAILGREGQRGLDSISTALDKQGTAARIAGARMTGLRGETANLTNQLDALGLTLGEKATPLLEALVATAGDGVQDINELVEAFGELERTLDRLPGSEDAQSFVTDLFGTALRNPARLFAPITELADDSEDAQKQIRNAGADIRSAIEDAGREGVAGARTFGDQISGAVGEALRNAGDVLAAAAKDFRNRTLRAVRGGEGQQSGLEEQFNAIIAGGGNQAQLLDNLRRQAQTQAKIIETAGPQAAGVALEARRRAQARLAQIAGQIKGIEDQIVQEREREAGEARQRAQDAQQARDDADRSFIELVRGRVGAADNRALAAEATAGLNDDIAAEKNKRAVLRRQIEEVRATVQDAQLRKAEIASLVRQDIEARNAITDLLQERRDAEREQRRKEALEAEERRDAVTEKLAKRAMLAELRGNDPAQLAALNAQIADARKRVALAKKAKKGIVDEQIALQELINARKDLIEAVKEGSEDVTGGTTLVDLFNRAQDILGGAGNVGQTAQSLRGLSANPELKAQVQQRLDIVNNPAAAAAARQERSNNLLIQAIDRLTLAMTGNTATGGPITKRDQNVWRNLGDEQRFFYQKQAKMMVEQGLTG
jgi:TP901 family phage tail tape measure protein